ncbi:MAG: hypothetical protein Q9167_005309 [Letrouitia subvulpina]
MAPVIQLLHHPFKDYEEVKDIQPEFCNFIVGLARTFDGKRLAALRQKNKWLDDFEPRFKQERANINFESSQEAFRNDGNAFLRALEEFADLYYKEVVSTSLSRTYLSFFMPLIAEISDHLRLLPEFEEDMEDLFNFDKDLIKKHHEAISACKTRPQIEDWDGTELRHWKRSLELIESRPFWLKEKIDVFARKWKNSRLDIEIILKQSRVRDFFKIVGDACLMKDQQSDLTYTEDCRYIDDHGVWWYVFQKNLRNFVGLVGSKKGSLNVDKNLQILQDINESRMRYVATMQQTIQQLNKTVSEQQQVITALKFRYLLENLPGPAYAADDKLGERWKKFWGDIATYYRKRNEDAKQAVIQDSGAVEGEEALDSTNFKDNHTSVAPALDRLFEGRRESKYGSKGRDLYSDLSEIIHRYKGNTYEIPELLFDPITSDILRALTPNQKENGNVEWSKEPLRYSQYADSVAKRKEEEKKKAEEAEAADPMAQEKKKQKDDAMQSLGAGLAHLKAQVQKLEQEVKKLKATSPVNAGDSAEQVDESPDTDSDDKGGMFGNTFD